MKCGNCHHDIAEGIQFCGNCGAPIAWGTPAQPAGPPGPPPNTQPGAPNPQAPPPNATPGPGPTNQQQPYQQHSLQMNSGHKKTNEMAIVAIVMLVFFPLLAPVFGFIALQQIKKTGEDGRVLALCSIWIPVGLTILVIAFFVLIFGLSAGSSGSY